MPLCSSLLHMLCLYKSRHQALCLSMRTPCRFLRPQYPRFSRRVLFQLSPKQAGHGDPTAASYFVILNRDGGMDQFWTSHPCVCQHDWMATIDLKEAFFYAPVTTRHRQFLKVYPRGYSVYTSYKQSRAFSTLEVYLAAISAFHVGWNGVTRAHTPWLAISSAAQVIYAPLPYTLAARFQILAIL